MGTRQVETNLNHENINNNNSAENLNDYQFSKHNKIVSQSMRK